MSTIDEMGDMSGFVPVQLYRDDIANVIYFKGVKGTTRCHISYDSRSEDIFKVCKPNEETRQYVPLKGCIIH